VVYEKCRPVFQNKVKIIKNTIFSGGQSCIDNPDVYQRGSHASSRGVQVIVPSTSINCAVRITGIAVSMNFGGFRNGGQPLIQIWRPSSPESNVYNKVAEVQLSARILIGNFTSGYFLENFTVNGTADFQSGDVIGYYQSSSPLFTIWNIETSGYTSYSNNTSSPATTINISDVDNVENDRQPLIELQYGRHDVFCKVKVLTLVTAYVLQNLPIPLKCYMSFTL